MGREPWERRGRMDQWLTPNVYTVSRHSWALSRFVPLVEPAEAGQDSARLEAVRFATCARSPTGNRRTALACQACQTWTAGGQWKIRCCRRVEGWGVYSADVVARAFFLRFDARASWPGGPRASRLFGGVHRTPAGSSQSGGMPLLCALSFQFSLITSGQPTPPAPVFHSTAPLV